MKQNITRFRSAAGWLLAGGSIATLALLMTGEHAVLVVLAALVSLASSAIAWHHRNAEPLVRQPCC
ncbi:MAG: hypothetical protein HC876_02445 [Chloroflexaceae bacterium]|nr:hypothetical protein [Chloroflexaceae bacterium]